MRIRPLLIFQYLFLASRILRNCFVSLSILFSTTNSRKCAITYWTHAVREAFNFSRWTADIPDTNSSIDAALSLFFCSFFCCLLMYMYVNNENNILLFLCYSYKFEWITTILLYSFLVICCHFLLSIKKTDMPYATESDGVFFSFHYQSECVHRLMKRIAISHRTTHTWCWSIGYVPSRSICLVIGEEGRVW